MTDLPMNARTAIPAGLTSAQGLDLDVFEPLNVPTQSWVTEAGARVSFVPARGLPMVDLTLRFTAGTAFDTQHSGCAALALYMLEEGVAGMDASEYAERLESLGAIVTKQLKLEHATLNLRSLSREDALAPALALFTQLVAQPDFPAPALSKVKRQLLARIASRTRQPALRARSEAYGYLFADHAYANPLGSTQEGLEALTVDDVQVFHQRAYCASNLQMVLVGDLSREQAEAISERMSQALPQGWAAIDPAPAASVPGKSIHVEQPGASCSLMLALALPVLPDSPLYAALELASEVLGSGLSSRLMMELRQKRGLTYGIHTALSPHPGGGVFSVQWDVKPELVASSQALVMDMLQAFIEHGPTVAELQLARQQIAARRLNSTSRNLDLAALLAECSAWRLPDGYLDGYLGQIASITPQMVHAATQLWAGLPGLVQVSVGPQVEQQALPPVPATDQ